jgi:hypothetical protein
MKESFVKKRTAFIDFILGVFLKSYFRWKHFFAIKYTLMLTLLLYPSIVIFMLLYVETTLKDV